MVRKTVYRPNETTFESAKKLVSTWKKYITRNQPMITFIFDEILNELRLRFTIKSEQPLMIRLVHPLTDEIYEIFNQLRKITVVKWDPSNPIPHPL